MTVGVFSNSGRLTGDIDLTVTKSFENRGYISVTNLNVTDSTIKYPTDSKIGKICWAQKFILNNIEVDKSYAKCE